MKRHWLCLHLEPAGTLVGIPARAPDRVIDGLRCFEPFIAEFEAVVLRWRTISICCVSRKRVTVLTRIGGVMAVS
jgi:hypothetical protein